MSSYSRWDDDIYYFNDFNDLFYGLWVYVYG